MAAQALLEQLGDGHQPHPPKPHVHEPIIGIHEDGLERQPHARRALLVYERRRAHGAVGVGRIAEVEEKLVELAELPAGEKIALLALGVRRSALAQVKHDAEVGRDDQCINQVDSTHKFWG